jgi:hypothetical protein
MTVKNMDNIRIRIYYEKRKNKWDLGILVVKWKGEEVWLFVICQFSNISSGLPQWAYTYVHIYVLFTIWEWGNREWTGMTLALRSHGANHMLAMQWA